MKYITNKHISKKHISKKLTALAKCRNPQRDYTALERIMDEKYSTDL